MISEHDNPFDSKKVADAFLISSSYILSRRSSKEDILNGWNETIMQNFNTALCNILVYPIKDYEGDNYN